MQQKSLSMMLSLLLGRYSIAQNMKSAYAGIPQTIVLLYWESSYFNSITVILEKITTAPSKIFPMEWLLFVY